MKKVVQARKEVCRSGQTPHCQGLQQKNMGGVDLSDMLMSLYRIAIRPRRWYLRIIYYLIDLSLSNGWLLYRRRLTQMQEKKYMSLLNFRAQVAVALIKVDKPADLTSRKRGGPSLEDAEEDRAPPPVRRIPAPSTIVRLDRFDHFPTNGEKRGRCRRCRMVTPKWPAQNAKCYCALQRTKTVS